MANVDGSKVVVNLHKKKGHHFILIDPNGQFVDGVTKATLVEGKSDQHPGLTIPFTIKHQKVKSSTKIVLRVRSEYVPAVAATQGERSATDTPASGQVTITLTNILIPLPVDPIPVNYIDDPDACDE